MSLKSVGVRQARKIIRSSLHNPNVVLLGSAPRKNGPMGQEVKLTFKQRAASEKKLEDDKQTRKTCFPSVACVVVVVDFNPESREPETLTPSPPRRAAE